MYIYIYILDSEEKTSLFVDFFYWIYFPFWFFSFVWVRYSHIELVEPFVTLAITPEGWKGIHFIQAFLLYYVINKLYPDKAVFSELARFKIRRNKIRKMLHQFTIQLTNQYKTQIPKNKDFIKKKISKA